MLERLKKLSLLFVFALIASCAATSDQNANRQVGEEDKKVQSDYNELASQHVLFDFDRSTIKASERKKLDAQAKKVITEGITKITIEGHTDYLGTKEYNIALGERRANATKRYLVQKGVDESIIRIVSYGQSRPVDPAETDEAREKNRRTVTLFSK